MKPPNDLKRCQDILIAITSKQTDAELRPTPEQVRWMNRARNVVFWAFGKPAGFDRAQRMFKRRTSP